MPRLTTTAVLAILLLAACGEPQVDRVDEPAATVPPTAPATPAPPSPTEEAPVTDDSLTGTLGGDAELEGGCAWLDTDAGRYEVLWPEGYRAEFEPLRLVGPDGGVVAEGGERITVHGAPAEGMMSFCQVGELFQAEHVERPG